MEHRRRCMPRTLCHLVVQRLFFIAFFITVSASWSVSAQEADTLAAAEVFSVKAYPVVKASEEVHLSQAVAVPTQMADIISKFTGVQVKDYGGVGGLKTINVRSLGSEHVGIFLDGIQIDNAQNMQVDLGRFSTEGLSAISLYNGQKTKMLQTAKEYASGAAVHLETQRPSLSNGQAGKVKLKAGSFATINPSVQWDKNLGRITLRTAAEFLTSNGKYKYPYFDTTLVRENGDIMSLRLEAMLFGNSNIKVSRGRWKLHLYSYGSERGFPGPVIRRAMGFPFSAERQTDQDLFIQGDWHQDWTVRYSTAFRFKYANNYTHYDTHPEKNPMALPYDLHYRQQSGYFSLAQSFVVSSPWSVDLSTDIQHNSLDSDVGQFVTPIRTVFTGALATRLVWDRFRAAAHLVYMGSWDKFYTPNAGGWTRENMYRDAWMPSLSLYYAPVKWIEMDVYAKRSNRLPSFNDLYYSQMGNSNLVPESAIQFGADIRFKHRINGWSGELRLSPYYNHVNNKIVAIPTSSQFRWTMLNIGKVDITGLDTKADIAYQNKDVVLNLVLRYTFQQALDHSSKESQTWGNQIPYIPRHSGGVDFTAKWREWAFCWDTVITGARWSRTANIPDYYIEPWTTTDLSFSKTFPFKDNRNLIVSLNCKNLFNQHYQIVQGYPMPGTNLMVTIEYTW